MKNRTFLELFVICKKDRFFAYNRTWQNWFALDVMNYYAQMELFQNLHGLGEGVKQKDASRYCYRSYYRMAIDHYKR